MFSGIRNVRFLSRIPISLFFVGISNAPSSGEDFKITPQGTTFGEFEISQTRILGILVRKRALRAYSFIKIPDYTHTHVDNGVQPPIACEVLASPTHWVSQTFAWTSGQRERV